MATAPNSDNYTLGRGRLLFDRKVNGAFTGLRDLGNATNFTLSMSTEKLDHYSNRAGIRVKDKSVLTSMAITGAFTLDEIMADNLAMTFLASITDVKQVAEQDQTTEIAKSKKGHYFQLDNKFIDEDSVVVTDATPKIYKVGTDYTIHGPSGQLFITAGSTIANGTALTVTYDTLAKTYKKLNAFDENSVEGELHFISDVAVGTNMQARMWSVTLMPSGDTGFISDEWNSLEFSLELSSDETNHPLFPYMELIVE